MDQHTDHLRERSHQGSHHEDHQGSHHDPVTVTTAEDHAFPPGHFRGEALAAELQRSLRAPELGEVLEQLHHQDLPHQALLEGLSPLAVAAHTLIRTGAHLHQEGPAIAEEIMAAGITLLEDLPVDEVGQLYELWRGLFPLHGLPVGREVWRPLWKRRGES